MDYQKVVLNAEKRDLVGRKVKQLRKSGKIPASMYGHDIKSTNLQFDSKELDKVISHEGMAGLVDVVVDEKNIPSLLKNPQYHPVTDELLHIDVYKVNLKEKITAKVKVEFIGESAAVKLGNVLMPVTNEIEVECLPTDLPEKVEVDISVLTDLDKMVLVKDLKFGKGIEVKTHEDQVVVKVEEPKEEEIEMVTTPAEATEQKAETEEGQTEGAKKEEKSKEAKEN